MSTDLQTAAADVKSVGRLFRSVIALADQLETVGNIDQAANESQKRLDDTNLQVAGVTNVLATARQQLADTDTAIDAAKTQAAGIVADAKTQAAGIVDDANVESAAIIAAANERAATIDGTIATQQAALDTLNATIATQQAALDTLNGNIENTKAQLRALAT